MIYDDEKKCVVQKENIDNGTKGNIDKSKKYHIGNSADNCTTHCVTSLRDHITTHDQFPALSGPFPGCRDHLEYSCSFLDSSILLTVLNGGSTVIKNSLAFYSVKSAAFFGLSYDGTPFIRKESRFRDPYIIPKITTRENTYVKTLLPGSCM